MSRHPDTKPWRRIAVVALAAAALGCGDDGAAGGEAAGGGEPTKLRTDDGYQVVTAEPREQVGPRPSKAGEAAERRRREQLVLEPTSPDPQGGDFTLEEAVVELPVDGQLVAEINTDLGSLFCDLYADKVPNTVANFVGLARGVRPFWDPAAGAWVERPYYRGTVFHRVIPDYLIQAGDHLGDGTGGVGYTIPDEVRDDLRHDKAGLLAMAADEPDQNGGQFFITDGPAPQLDGRYTIFGRCQPLEVINRIARVPQTGGPDNRPLTPVQINRLLIRRVRGGAANATITQPRMPEGFDPSMPGGPGRSKAPGSLRHEIEERERQRRGTDPHGH